MIRLIEVEVVLVASQSKSCQKVEELSKCLKNLKGLKSCKGHRFGGTFTEAPILIEELELPFLLGPGAFLIPLLERLLSRQS